VEKDKTEANLLPPPVFGTGLGFEDNEYYNFFFLDESRIEFKPWSPIPFQILVNFI
jgi:hypothetical protein